MAKIKDKERILKASREKQLVTYKGTLIKLVDNFSAETLQATREWHYIFKVMKGKNLQPRIHGKAISDLKEISDTQAKAKS